MSASDLRAVLDAARAAALHTTDLGNRFERMCAAALTAHSGPNGSERFEKVWLWSEWPGNDGPDTGIDLVAKQTEKFGGGLCAIQCKFYGDREISTQAVDSFLAASGRVEFTHRALMHTAAGIQRHGEAKLRAAHPKCEIFDQREMGRWAIDWWAIAEKHHVVAPGTPRSQSAGSKMMSGLRSTASRYWGAWRKRWSEAGVWLRLWLLIEGLVVGALMVAVVAAAVALVVVGLICVVLAALAQSGSGGKRRRRR